MHLSGLVQGGKGNFPIPCNINEVPRPSLNNQGVIGKNGLAIDSRILSNFFILIFFFLGF
jgi:hypothetical protein